MKINFLWDWFDFGVMVRVFKNADGREYKVSIDIQIAWLDIWIEIIKNKQNGK